MNWQRMRENNMSLVVGQAFHGFQVALLLFLALFFVPPLAAIVHAGEASYRLELVAEPGLMDSQDQTPQELTKFQAALEKQGTLLHSVTLLLRSENQPDERGMRVPTGRVLYDLTLTLEDGVVLELRPRAVSRARLDKSLASGVEDAMDEYRHLRDTYGVMPGTTIKNL
ncbi:MAG: hypothetical protein V3573_08205 [Desulfovibrionaceae bacterium]